MVDEINTAIVLEFVDKTFLSEGLPGTILSDNGVQFMSNAARDYFTRWVLSIKPPPYIILAETVL